MMYTVYKHTCPNGKMYVGITSKEPEKRWNNGNGYQKNPHFWQAIRKYGWDNIRHEILFEGLTKIEACHRESELIKGLQSNDPRNGYNLSSGGESGCKGYKWTDEQKRKLSTRPRRKHTDEARKKISISKRGEKNPNYGKQPSEETRRRQSESSKRENLSAETRKRLSEAHKRPVYCIELESIFASAKDAEKCLGILATSICKVLQGTKGHKTAGGYHWEYWEVEK